jgi:hypothetical protein
VGVGFFPVGDVHSSLANPPQKSPKKVLALDRVNEVKTQPVTQEIRRGVTVKQP